MRQFICICAVLWAPVVHTQTANETLRLRVEQLHDSGGSLVRGERLLQKDAVAHFFQSRGFEPAWRLPSAAEQIHRAIVAMEQEGLTPADYHLASIGALLAAKRSPADDADLQVLLADAVAATIDHVRYGKVHPVSLDRRWNVDPRAGAPSIESELVRVASSAAVFDAIAARRPNHFIYNGLKQALARLRAIEAAGGWPSVKPGPTLKPGASDPRVSQTRARLVVSGELPAGSSVVDHAYDPLLEAAVKRFQERHRLSADGSIGKVTVDAMNVSAKARAEQVRANLERARWVLAGLEDTFVLVNLPAFKVYYIRGGKNVWEARTQIGREARQTPTFRADMKYLVFNPDWTVPPTILAKDVLGGMKKGQNTIAKKHLTILDRRGQPVDPSTIDWAAAAPGRFPYTLRQPPGANNALGRVKFIFPNEHSIFLHDTPSRELFSADTRTFSSGCNRVEHPLDFAAALLERQGDWSAGKITQTVERGRSETVLFDEPIPLLIVYWTVSVGVSDELRFARDVYARDPPLLRALNACSYSAAAARESSRNRISAAGARSTRAGTALPK